MSDSGGHADIDGLGLDPDDIEGLGLDPPHEAAYSEQSEQKGGSLQPCHTPFPL